LYQSDSANEQRAEEASMPRPSSLTRATVVVGTILAGVLIGGTPASAGGGCHTGPTQGTGTAVDLKGACFTPSLLRVAEGSTVTFTNYDPEVHNISGSLWGHYDNLAPGESFSASFDRAGLYPFACTIHPGMTGVIVVGDGTGPGNGSVVTDVPTGGSGPTTIDAASATAPVTRGVRWAQAIALTVGLAFGVCLGIAFAPRRRTQNAGLRVPSS
jgi:plastocyanin